MDLDRISEHCNEMKLKDKTMNDCKEEIWNTDR